MSDEHIHILDQLTAVNLSVSIWTARKKLTADDFGGVDLPPEELASLGSKKICDPENLKIFAALKARATSHLDKIGVRFLSGWAIPDDQRHFLYDRLVEIKTEFLDAKETFLNDYELAVQNWIAKHPGWERLISDSTVSVDEVKNRLSFNWQFYKVVPPDQTSISDSLLTETANLGQTLFEEIAKESRSMWNKVFAGKTEVSHKALSPLKAMRQKLTGLSFVEPRVSPIADLIEDTLQSMPKRGLISGQHLLLLHGLTAILKDPVELFERGQRVLNGQSFSSVLQGAQISLEVPISGVPVKSNKLELLDKMDDLDYLDNSNLLNDLNDMINDDNSSDSSTENDEKYAQTESDQHSLTTPGLNSFGLW
jgi:hypothetical protein